MPLVTTRTACDGSDSRSQKGVGDHDLRCGKFLCPVRPTSSSCLRSCIKAQPWSLPKFITTLQSRFLKGPVLHSLSLADPAAILRTFIHSLSRCSSSPSPLPSSSSLCHPPSMPRTPLPSPRADVSSLLPWAPQAQDKATYSILLRPLPVAISPSVKTSIVPPLFRQIQTGSLMLRSQASEGEYFIHAQFFTGDLVN